MEGHYAANLVGSGCLCTRSASVFALIRVYLHHNHLRKYDMGRAPNYGPPKDMADSNKMLDSSYLTILVHLKNFAQAQLIFLETASANRPKLCKRRFPFETISGTS